MGRIARSIPLNYPPALAAPISKADALRQISIVRQEIITDLLSLLADTHEADVRRRLIRCIESNLKAGLLSSSKAESLWPSVEDATRLIQQRQDAKPAVSRRHLSLFNQLDRTHRRSLALLQESFQHGQEILSRLQASGSSPTAESATARTMPN
jgi:hypothetical protein